ncbi:SpoIID/LytB domain-containing protein [Ectobacillus sp. JY-23]|uniref:SpoIID/LytB domain-containing protein n=1 Tax=Ectobacillus sp. JY-23 TaxID=2933872 RepID=UPI001FF232B7|nr:SpoIID/LytB domain-containing protein [Ectobacillus sp. JY-23]UOY91147.1 SpoIID/LytB domain-containing protein [Ectobacillus sp. JY-23]
MKRFYVLLLVFAVVFAHLSYSTDVKAETIEPTISVKLVNYLGNKSEITIKPSGTYLVKDTKLQLEANVEYQIKATSDGVSLHKGSQHLGAFTSLEVTPFRSSSILWIGKQGYLGNILFTNESGKYVRPINTLPLEDYVKGVVPMEMPAYWNAEALKAQAVAARTYALGYINKVIDDTIRYQVYGGYMNDTWYKNSNRAVDETFGQVLKYQDALISAVFSASNGGRTESNANAWGSTALPYLTIKGDPYDTSISWELALQKMQIDLANKDLKNPGAWWDATKETDTNISSNIKAWMLANGYAGKDIKIVSIPKLSLYAPSSGGRVTKGDISITYIIKDQFDSAGKLSVQQLNFTGTTAAKIRAIIGNRVILSYLVTEAAENEATITIKGNGDGHGVGMSQYGAKKMGELGKTYQEIVAFYYTGTTLSSVYQIRPVTKPQVNPVGDSDKVVTGAAGSDVTITVKGNGSILGSGQADAAGDFAVPIPVQKAGTKLTITASDQAGHVSEVTEAVVQDKAPLAPNVNIITDKTTAVTGTAEANTTVYVKVGSTLLGRKTVDSAGRFSVPISVQKAGTKIRVVVRDSSGNYSPYTSVMVQDKTAPLAPKVNIITDQATTVTGTAEANATVYVKVGATILGRQKVNTAGAFSVSIPVQTAGIKVRVVVRDSSGNYSPYTTVTVQSI